MDIHDKSLLKAEQLFKFTGENWDMNDKSAYASQIEAMAMDCLANFSFFC